MDNPMAAILPARIVAKIQHDNGCWIWTAARDKRGYGRVRWGNGTCFAHRLVYMLTTGAPEAGLELDHLCRRPACVNPRHLEPVTHLVNVRRGRASESARAQGAKYTHCPQGHPLSGANLYAYKARDGSTNKQCRICRRASDQRRRARRRAARV